LAGWRECGDKPSGSGATELISFSKTLESIINNHLSFYFKFNPHTNQHSFIKSKFIVTNLATYLNTVLPSVCSQGQFDSVYFELSQVFDTVPLTLLLDKLLDYIPFMLLGSRATYQIDLPLYITNSMAPEPEGSSPPS
jgi:hypothetical protein